MSEFTLKQLKMLRQCMYFHIRDREEHFSVICRKEYRNRFGKIPTKEDINNASQAIKDAESLYKKLQEKSDG